MKTVCKLCGEPVNLKEDGQVERHCEHEGAPVVAELTAVCTGESTCASPASQEAG